MIIKEKFIIVNSKSPLQLCLSWISLIYKKFFYHTGVISIINKYLTDIRGLKIFDLEYGTGRISGYLADCGGSCGRR
jgi:hypothetical protein